MAISDEMKLEIDLAIFNIMFAEKHMEAKVEGLAEQEKKDDINNRRIEQLRDCRVRLNFLSGGEVRPVDAPTEEAQVEPLSLEDELIQVKKLILDVAGEEYSLTPSQRAELRKSSLICHFLYDQCGNCYRGEVGKDDSSELGKVGVRVDSGLKKALFNLWAADKVGLTANCVAELISNNSPTPEEVTAVQPLNAYRFGPTRKGIERIEFVPAVAKGAGSAAAEDVEAKAAFEKLKGTALEAHDVYVRHIQSDTYVDSQRRARATLIEEYGKKSVGELKDAIDGFSGTDEIREAYISALGALPRRPALIYIREVYDEESETGDDDNLSAFLQLKASDACYHAPALPNAAQANGMLGADSANDNIHNMFTLMFFLLAMFLVSKVWRKLNKTHGRTLKNGESAGTPLASFSQLS